MNRSLTLRRLAYSAMALALCLVLPFLTGQIPQIGQMLLPMHLPVLLCGFLCSWQWGLAVGFLAPLLRSALFHMPGFYPMALCMAFEMAAYGLLAGLLYSRSKWKCVLSLYRSLILAMLGGRVVWGIVRVICSGVSGNPFTWKLFLSGAFLTAIPGIVLQLVFIPLVMIALDRTGAVKFSRKPRTETVS